MDDQQIIIDGLSAVLRNHEDVEVIGFANDGKEALFRVQELTPDVVLLDFNMPEMNGLETVSYLLKSYPNLNILMLTGYDDITLITETLRRGALGYVLKNINKDELVHAIKTVNNKKRYLDLNVQNKVIDALVTKPSIDTQQVNDTFVENIFTKRELEILKMIAKGRTSQDIAKELFISTNTVDTHRKHLLSKCGANNTAELLSYANRNKII